MLASAGRSCKPTARLRAYPEMNRPSGIGEPQPGAAKARSSFTSQAYPPQAAARHGDAKVRPEGPLNFES